MAKKPKTKKQKLKEEKEKREERSAGLHDADAVKLFLVVMVVMVVGLGVLILFAKNQLSEYEDSIALAKVKSASIGNDALEIQAYLKLIRDTEETTLMQYPERFFGGIYGQPQIAISQTDVTTGPQRSSVNRTDKYTEYSWSLDMKNLSRRQGALFLWGVEDKSPKARTLEVTMRRDKKDEEGDQWAGSFKIGYRVAGVVK
jgi:hypothetical protein